VPRPVVPDPLIRRTHGVQTEPRAPSIQIMTARIYRRVRGSTGPRSKQFRISHFTRDTGLCRSEKYLSPYPPTPYRPTVGRPDRPGGSFRTLVRPARAEGVPSLTGQKGVEAGRMRRNAAPPGTHSRAFACDGRLAQAPAVLPGTGFAPSGAANPRVSSVLAFLCSRFPACVRAFLKDWEGETRDCGGRPAG